jgi:toxin ParE1/3/4
MEITIAPQARSDIKSILSWTQEHFGPLTLKRYARLIETAIAEIAANPDCAGSESRPEIAGACRTYHLFHARKKAATGVHRVRKPRHFLLYRVRDGIVELGRVLHDSMDFQEQIPPEYRASEGS